MNISKIVEAFLEDQRPDWFTKNTLLKWTAGKAPDVKDSELSDVLDQMCEDHVLSEKLDGRTSYYSAAPKSSSNIELDVEEKVLYSKWLEKGHCASLSVGGFEIKSKLTAYAWQEFKKENANSNCLVICESPHMIGEWVSGIHRLLDEEPVSYGGENKKWLNEKPICVASCSKAINQIEKRDGLRHIGRETRLLMIIDKCDVSITTGKKAPIFTRLFQSTGIKLMHFPDSEDKKHDVYDLPEWLRWQNLFG